jgi:hypothetical protein
MAEAGDERATIQGLEELYRRRYRTFVFVH